MDHNSFFQYPILPWNEKKCEHFAAVQIFRYFNQIIAQKNDFFNSAASDLRIATWFGFTTLRSTNISVEVKYFNWSEWRTRTSCLRVASFASCNHAAPGICFANSQWTMKISPRPTVRRGRIWAVKVSEAFWIVVHQNVSWHIYSVLFNRFKCSVLDQRRPQTLTGVRG